jgi:hypothetical protein
MDGGDDPLAQRPDPDDSKWIHAGLRSKTKKAMTMQANKLDGKMERLVDWNTDVLVRLLKQIIARQSAQERTETREGREAASRDFVAGDTVIDEVVEIIELPKLDASASRQQALIDEIELDPTVVLQVRTYIQTIATMYRANPFHNFEHVSILLAIATVIVYPVKLSQLICHCFVQASHVTMSVTKLLSRIVAPSEILNDYRDHAGKDLVSTLHDHTYGINSDPLTQFACVFAALIHDVSSGNNLLYMVESRD